MEHNQGQLNAYRESCTAASAVTCKLNEWGRKNGGVGHLCGVAVRYYVGVVMVRKKKRKKGRDTDVKPGIARRPVGIESAARTVDI